MSVAVRSASARGASPADRRRRHGTGEGDAGVLLSCFFNDTAPPEIYTLSLHDALPIFDIEMRLQIREGPARLQFDRQKSGRRRLHPEVIEQFLEIEIGRIKSCIHLSVARENGLKIGRAHV